MRSWYPNSAGEAESVLIEVIARTLDMFPNDKLTTRPPAGVRVYHAPVTTPGWEVAIHDRPDANGHVSHFVGTPSTNVVLTFVEAWFLQAGLGPQPSNVLEDATDLVVEEIVGPTYPSGAWGLTTRQASKRPAHLCQTIAQEMMLRCTAVLPPEHHAKTCKSAEDHVFVGGSACFVCSKTAAEVYGFAG